ncbi:unnamed protein product [Penicillium camemberti]|uniref:Str. FM013 n=1 Tax=Penicillium camemberti (strain FM 013) TaxID=1429867 RepID=A0A0G4P8L3_PENC3|nr:unnamed protein product [Penicillium camemberti]
MIRCKPRFQNLILDWEVLIFVILGDNDFMGKHNKGPGCMFSPALLFFRHTGMFTLIIGTGIDETSKEIRLISLRGKAGCESEQGPPGGSRCILKERVDVNPEECRKMRAIEITSGRNGY